MKTNYFRIIIVVVALLLARPSNGQNTDVQQEAISASRSLAGHVLMRLSESPANDVTVELCTPNWNQVMKSTQTDASGYFNLGIAESGKLYYLRLSKPGVKSYMLRVRLKQVAKKELLIHLNFAS